MDIEPIFYSFLATDYLNIDNNALKDICYNKVKNDPVSVENQCYINQSEASDPGTVFNTLFNEIQDRIDYLYSHLELSKKYSFQIRNAWINLDENVNIGATHCHVESTLSGVYYVDATEGAGNIEFISPVVAAPYTFFAGSRERMNGFNAERWEVTPEAGKLIIFPSWLYHRVKPCTPDSKRISIAFNANFIDASYKR